MSSVALHPSTETSRPSAKSAYAGFNASRNPSSASSRNSATNSGPASINLRYQLQLFVEFGFYRINIQIQPFSWGGGHNLLRSSGEHESKNPAILHPYNPTILRSYNPTILQSYNLTTLWPYNLTILQSYKIIILEISEGQNEFTNQTKSLIK